MQISITLKGVDQVRAAIRRMERVSSMVAEWFATGEPDRIMRKSFQQNFNQGGRPDWEPLAVKTQETRALLGINPTRPILVRTGNFMDEIVTMDHSLVLGNREVIATWGEENLRPDEAKKFREHMTGHRNMPARKMIGFQDADAKALTSSLGRFIKSQFV